MHKTININTLKIMAFTALFITLSLTVYAQDTDAVRSIPSNPTIGQGQSNSTAQDTFFNGYASRFAISLAKQTGLSNDKIGEIRKILIDYYNDITETRQDFLRGMQDTRNAGSTAPNGDNSDNAVGSKRGTGRTDNAQSEAAGNANQTAIAQDLMSEYRKADVKADDKILDVLDNDSQKNKYVKVKRQWWQSVKNVVYSTANQNSGGMQTK